MCGFTDLAMTLQTLLTTEAEDAARQSRCVQRQRKLSGATFVQTLTLGWLHDPNASLDSLADFAADLGADITPQALDQRFTPAATHGLALVLTAALHRLLDTTRRHSLAATLPGRLYLRHHYRQPPGGLGRIVSWLWRQQRCRSGRPEQEIDLRAA